MKIWIGLLCFAGPAVAMATVPETPKARVAIVLDDVGKDPALDQPFFDLGIPITMAILPNTEAAAAQAKKAQAKGIPVLVHMPMEPVELDQRDGPDFLMRVSESSKLRKLIRKHLEVIPGARGVNGHMGSAFTADKKAMKVFLKGLKEKNLYYIDSRTTPDTVGLELAREMKIKALERDVFADDVCSKDACTADDVLKSFQKAESVIWRRFNVVIIVHPHAATHAALVRWIASIRDADKRITFVRAEELLP